MDILIANGINWIIAIQGMGAWLQAPMQFFTSLGYEDFYLLLLPILYWCVDSRLGLRVGLILIASSGLNNLFKLAFTGPRPYWVSTQVQPYSAESSFGIPSGHAQNAVSVWGMMAAYIRKPWAWITAIALMFLIGFSRLYLGVHFPHDVFAGWLIGAVILTLFINLWNSLSARIQKMTLGGQILLAFAVSMTFVLIGGLLANGLRGFVLPAEWMENALRAGPEPDPVSLDGILTSAGTLFGLSVGAAWIMSMGGFQAEGPVWKRALRYVVGLVGVVIFWMGLGAVFPRQEELISYILRFLRYTLVGFWVTGGAPWLFFRFNLASPAARGDAI
ncbi:MAG: phosphatase PAP2 family protein [Chloroflexi bacterium]|nr:phosphatase PAP2 family protein [Chloroflexota bacterium]